MGTDINLGQRIRSVRLSKKLTQNDVVGSYMTRNMLSKIENGSATPSVRTLEYLARALDVPVSYFLDGHDREQLDTGQLREIDALAQSLSAHAPGSDATAAIALCIRARSRLTEGRHTAALTLFDGIRPENFPKEVRDCIYSTIEDCHRLMGNFKLAYEYALKRIRQ